MAKYRKKPVVVEAVRLVWENWSEVCDFVGVGKLEDGKPQGTDKDVEGNPLPDGGPGMNFPTLEGIMLAMPGDWIIREPFATPDRRFYPCKPDIFEDTYEEVTE